MRKSYVMFFDFLIGLLMRMYFVNFIFFLRAKEIEEARGISPREEEEGCLTR